MVSEEEENEEKEKREGEGKTQRHDDVEGGFTRRDGFYYGKGHTIPKNSGEFYRGSPTLRLFSRFLFLDSEGGGGPGLDYRVREAMGAMEAMIRSREYWPD